MSKRWLGRPGALFVLVLIWKVCLFLISAQPVPANDSFFYDGPVVNLLLHGRYVNPALALALPISGREVFSAYPPLYQGVLLGWMSLFGTSALVAMALHLVLFGIYVALVWLLLGELKVPAQCLWPAGLFLFALTFHDRPDSLAHVLGMSALYCWSRSTRPPTSGWPEKESRGWSWLMALLVTLTFCTSLQIGAVYCLVVWTTAASAGYFAHEPLPVAPLLSTVLVPAILVAVVRLGFPHLWAGFLEHASQTPSLTGWRWPQLGDLLKIGRTAPGALAALGLLGAVWLKRPPSQAEDSRSQMISRGLGLAVLAVVVGCLLVLTPNMVVIGGYLQPILVATAMAVFIREVDQKRNLAKLNWLFAGLALLASVRAIGMSTWGLACARDVNYTAAIQRVREEIAAAPTGETLVFSAGYLYEAARQDRIRWIHSDWLAKARRGEPDSEQALLEVKPAKLILTQFDYYRRYAPLLAALRAGSRPVDFRVDSMARTPPPDSSPRLQRIVQHVCWAPVVITFRWK